MDRWTRILATPVAAGDVTIPNRLVAQPMERSAASPGGNVTPALLQDYERLATGGWGMIIIEAMSVSPAWKSRRGQLVISEGTEPDVARLVSCVKALAPGTLVVLQLTFPGMVTGEGLAKSTILPDVHGADPSITLLADGDIETILDQFGVASRIALRAGADGIDIKACHGYLGVEFLRPANTRPGPFGGSFENRVRFMERAFASARDAVQAAGREGSFLLGSRVSVWEGIPGGFGTGGPGEVIEDLREPLDLAARMEAWGAGYINVTAGIPATLPEITRPSKTAPWGAWNHFRLAKAIRDGIRARAGKLLVIGSAYSMAGPDATIHAARNVESGGVDLAGFGRQVLADPGFARKVIEGDAGKIQACIGCNRCAGLLRAQRHVGCAHHDPAFAASGGDGT